MDEIDLLRGLDADVPPASVGAREASRRRLLTRAAELGPVGTGRRPRRLMRGFGLAFGAVGLAFALLFGVAVWPVPFLPRVGPAAAASEILRHAADAAARLPAFDGTGYRYTKSQGTWLSRTMSVNDGEGYSLLRPITREIWIAVDGSGRIRETVGDPIFLTEVDLAAWVAAGSPGDRGIDADFGPGGLFYAANQNLPTDPIALRGLVFARAIQTKVPVNVEMFVIVGDMLRETVAEPALRSALFQVAATIDGVEVIGPTTDQAGRTGVGVGLTGGAEGERIRRVLIFDERTFEFLGEQEIAVDALPGIPAGSVFVETTYLAAEIVDHMP